MDTLPTWAASWTASLDAVRKLVRRDPELRTLGTYYGPVRMYSAEEAGRIRRKWLDRVAARKVMPGKAAQKK